jgi:tripartite-type tricarboxylate transporter receptor subunit TctC
MRNLLGALIALPFLFATAHAQTDYPTQPVTMVVGFPAGGGMDTIARIVGERAAQELGQQVVVENRAGAGGTIAAAHAAGARPDGYTIYLGETSALFAPIVHGDVGYNPLESFVAVAHLTSAPLALVAHPDVGATNMQEFIDLVRANPGEFFYATPGIATIQHLAVEILQDMADLDLEQVPFQGGSPSVAAVVSGEVPFGIVSLNAAVAQAADENLIILGVTSADRVADFPDIPAISETVPGFAATPSQFVMAPAETPEAAIQALSAAIGATMNDPAVIERLSSMGFNVDYMDGPALAAELPAMTERWTAAAQAAQ